MHIYVCVLGPFALLVIVVELIRVIDFVSDGLSINGAPIMIPGMQIRPTNLTQIIASWELNSDIPKYSTSGSNTTELNLKSVSEKLQPQAFGSRVKSYYCIGVRSKANPCKFKRLCKVPIIITNIPAVPRDQSALGYSHPTTTEAAIKYVLTTFPQIIAPNENKFEFPLSAFSISSTNNVPIDNQQSI